jgi:hypothetical protein
LLLHLLSRTRSPRKAQQSGKAERLALAVPTMEIPLSFIDGAFVPIDLSPRNWQKLASKFRIVEASSLDAHRLRFQHGSLPEECQNSTSFVHSYPLDQLAHNFQIAPIRRDKSELLLGGLKDAEGGVRRAIDNLNVFHAVNL